MISDKNSFRNILEQRKGQQKQIQQNIDIYEQERRQLKRDLLAYEKANEIIKKVGLNTQKQLQYQISEIASLALEAIFPDPYTLEIEFVERRGKTECDLLFARKEEKIDPISASGGGAIDIAAFALRVASWSMSFPQPRNVLILDEPFRYLSIDLLPLAGMVLKQISQKLNLQIIMVTHSEELIQHADAVFHVSMKKGISIVEEVGEK